MTLHFIFIARQYFFNRMPYYAVAKGRKSGIYATWDECSIQVLKFPGSIYKKFATESEAQNFIKERSSSNIGPSLTKNCISSKMVKPVEKITSNADFIFTESSDQDSKVDFIMDENGYVNVFTDGACSSNGYKNARAGIGVWFQDNHPLNVSRPVEGRPTNNMAEIQAVTVAARQAKKAGWKKRGWKTVDNKPVINKTELLEMERELKSLTIAWNHINGHVGIHGNEMADKLARKGCLLYESK